MLVERARMGVNAHRRMSWSWLLVLVLTGAAWAVAVWGAWVPHAAVALRVAGVDMAEVVKFLPGVRAGQVHIWREGFLLPQVTLSVFLAGHAWQRRWPFPLWLRLLLQLAAVSTALSMLPPAWSPALLRAPEWQQHTRILLLTLTVAFLSPLFRFVPGWVVDVGVALLALGTGIVVAWQLSRVWPEFEQVYNLSLTYGVGVWGVGIGVTGALLLLGQHVVAAKKE